MTIQVELLKKIKQDLTWGYKCMRELAELRAELDVLDTELVRLFEKRMGIAREVAAYKQAKGMNVLDSSREQQVLDSRAAKLENKAWEPDVRRLFTEIMAMSRAEQERFLKEAPNHV